YSDRDGDAVTGNTLQLEAAGLSAPVITNFETIILADSLAWENDATVLKAGEFADNSTTDASKQRASLDVRDVTKDGSELVKTTTDGQMTLLASDTADFKTLSLIYSDGTEALSEKNLSKVVRTVETPEAAPVNGVTIKTKNTHTVSLDKENSYQNVLYQVSSVASNVTLGGMTWGTGRDVSKEGLTFNETTAIDASRLTFSGTDTTLLKEGSTKTLVKGATGITNKHITQPDEGNGTVAVDYKENGIAFDATAKGDVKAAVDAVNYVVSTVTVNGVNLDKWNGTTTAVTSGWEGENVAVDTGNFKTPSGLSNSSKVVLTADKGFFGDVTGAKAYKDDEPFEQEDQNGVKLDGNQVGGVKANEAKDTLTFYDMRKTGTALTLGTITTAFAAGGKAVATYDSGYDLTAAEITADDFKFTDGIKDAKAGDKMVVVDATKAIKNADNQTLKGFGGKDVDVEFSDNVKEKLNLAGTRSDKLTQNGAKTQLIYTVGDKNVTTATFSGPIAWNANEAYYTNDGYTFSGDTGIDAKDLTFEPVNTALAADAKMTLVVADGITEGNTVTQPSDGTLDV
ncbi:MAG: hypothetical protein J5492_01245, partial [Oxalobacter sp.]|nr:hypothetical protein [Oxalobacter sp.]